MKRKLVSSLLTLVVTMLLLSGCGSTTSSTTTNVETTTSEEESSLVDETSNEIDCGNIVFYATLPGAEYTWSDLDGYETLDHKVTLNTSENYPIYNGDGVNVGYIKSGVSIDMEAQNSTKTYRIANPYDAVDYDYLYITTWNAMDYGAFSDAYTYDEYWALFDEAIDKAYEEMLESRANYLAEHPDVDEASLPEIIKTTRVDSMDGLEQDGELAPSLMKADCTEDDIMMDAELFLMKYEEYYVDVIRYSYGYLDFNLYVKTKEN
jgi:uncharacterized protein YceK